MHFLRGILKAISRGTGWIEDNFIVIVTAFLILGVFGMVITRYVLEVPTPYLEELTRWVLIGLTFVGFAAVTRKDAHIKADLLQLFKVKELTRRKIHVVADILVFLANCILAYACYQFAAYAWSLPGVSNTMPTVRLAWVESTLFVGAILSVFHLAAIVIKETRDLIKDIREQ